MIRYYKDGLHLYRGMKTGSVCLDFDPRPGGGIYIRISSAEGLELILTFTGKYDPSYVIGVDLI